MLVCVGTQSCNPSIQKVRQEDHVPDKPDLHSESLSFFFFFKVGEGVSGADWDVALARSKPGFNPSTASKLKRNRLVGSWGLEQPQINSTKSISCCLSSDSLYHQRNTSFVNDCVFTLISSFFF